MSFNQQRTNFSGAFGGTTNNGVNLQFVVMSMDDQGGNGQIPFPQFNFSTPQQNGQPPNMRTPNMFPPGFPPQLVNQIFQGFAPTLGGLSGLFNNLGFNFGEAQQAPPGFASFQDWLDHLFHQNQPRGTPPASKAFVQNLPEITIDSIHISEKSECAVCKDVFSLGDTATQLPCAHMYHMECIQPWLNQHCTCPVCRYELPVDDPEYEKQRKQRMAERNVMEEELLRKNAEKVDLEAIKKLEEEAERLAEEVLKDEQLCEIEKSSKTKCTILKPNGSYFVTLTCGHSFHSECLESSLRIDGNLHSDSYLNAPSNFRCPQCRENVSILRDLEVD